MKKTIIGVLITLAIALAFVFSANSEDAPGSKSNIVVPSTGTKQLADPPVGMSYKLSKEAPKPKKEKAIFY
ncbi:MULTISPECIES: hypothetical protein [Bacillus subtilis group]|mgnify:FL=1|uniref:hypothetical protein n=1 Tax=Bacillus subtilis group TaxID=653685 RepID=UPI0013A54AE5|nr:MULTISPECIES: hypothetical protein [Bacillus subtilis group]MBV5123277.1 hypothetical protein [Bacillus halotolerans]MCM3190394.1 hypothetical protein [Bacillus subtilis]